MTVVKTWTDVIVKDIMDSTCMCDDREGKTMSLDDALKEAVIKGQLSDVRKCISEGANVNYKDGMNVSVLDHAIINLKTSDTIEIFFELTNNGADINNKTISGQTEFMFLVHRGVVPYDYIAQLLDNVSDVYERNLLTGGTYMHVLTKRRDDVSGRITIMKKLLEKGLNVNSRDNNDDTPLILMAMIACRESMLFLLENGADSRTTNRQGENMLHILACGTELAGFSTCLDLIMQQDISINSVDNHDWTPLHHAARTRETKCAGVIEMASKGLQMNKRDKLGRNEIYHAVTVIDHTFSDEQMDEREEIIKLMSVSGVNVNQGNVRGVTALHLSVSCVLSSMLCITGTLLYTLDADPLARTNSGATPLHWACRTFNQAAILVHWYQSHSLDINVVDSFGCSALHWAVWFRQIPVARLLLQRGVDPAIQDALGQTALDLARKLHLNSFEKLLQDYQYPKYSGLIDNDFQCSESDTMFACEQLRYIKKINGQLAIDEYIEHVRRHKKCFRSLVDTVLDQEHMGLYNRIDENAEIADLVKALMHTIHEKVVSEYPILRCNLQLAGSNYEGTKVNLPDEFDYKWKFEHFGMDFIPVESDDSPGGFIKLKLRNSDLLEQYSRFVSSEGYLDCKLLLVDLYTSINKHLDIVLLDDMFQNLVCSKYLNEISYSIDNLVLVYYGREAKCMYISVDIVPTIDLGYWTPHDFDEKDRVLLQTLGDTWECSVVFKTPDRVMVPDFTQFYRLSFAFLEQSILRRVPKCIKKGYILLKSLAESKYFPQCVDHDNKKRVIKYIVSYHIKTAFLFELEVEQRNSKLSIDETLLTDDECRNISLQWAYRIIGHLEKRLGEMYVF